MEAHYVLEMQAQSLADGRGCLVAWCAPAEMTQAWLQCHNPATMEVYQRISASAMTLQPAETLTAFHLTTVHKRTRFRLYVGTSHGRVLTLTFAAASLETPPVVEHHFQHESAIQTMTYDATLKLLLFGAMATMPLDSESDTGVDPLQSVEPSSVKPFNRKRKRQPMAPVVGLWRKKGKERPHLLFDVAAEEFTVIKVNAGAHFALAASMDGTVTQLDLRQLDAFDAIEDEERLLGTMNVGHSVADLQLHDMDHVLVRGHDGSLSEWNIERATALHTSLPSQHTVSKTSKKKKIENEKEKEAEEKEEEEERLIDVFVSPTDAAVYLLCEQPSSDPKQTGTTIALRQWHGSRPASASAVARFPVDQPTRSSLFVTPPMSGPTTTTTLYLGAEDGKIAAFALDMLPTKKTDKMRRKGSIDQGSIQEELLGMGHVTEEATAEAPPKEPKKKKKKTNKEESHDLLAMVTKKAKKQRAA